MEQTSIIGQIFEKYFEILKDKMDHEIVDSLKEVFEREDFTETNLSNFIKWLEDYNAKDKKS